MGTTVVSISSIQSGVSAWIASCQKRVALLDGYLNKVVKQDYINSQNERFQTENAGDDFDGGRWANIDPKYSEYKKKKYSEYPGGGDKTLVATSNLLQSLTLSDQFYPSPVPKKIRHGRKGSHSRGEEAAGSGVKVDAGSIHIYTLVPYAKYVDEKRTFSTWSQHFWDRINAGIMNYMAGKNG